VRAFTEVKIRSNCLCRLFGTHANAIPCICLLQERLAESLAPVAMLALSAFAGSKPQLNTTSNTTSLHSSTDDFLGAMALNRLLTAAALVDADAANKLCDMFNQAAAAAGDGAGAAALLGHIHPDLRHAVLDVAAAQPPGCHLDWSGAQRGGHPPAAS
jgi:hypothetical protein